VTTLERRSFSLAGHRTSVALEPEFWEVLGDLAAQQGTSLTHLIAEADSQRRSDHGLASTLRLLALRGLLERSDGK